MNGPSVGSITKESQRCTWGWAAEDWVVRAAVATAAAAGQVARGMAAGAVAGWVAGAREMVVLATAAVGLARVGVGMGAAGCRQVKRPAEIGRAHV